MRRAARALVASLLALTAASGSGLARVGGVERLHPRSIKDYGSGATVQTQWYSPGGIGGGVGAFAGHPNTLSRSDRVLVRFDVSPLFLLPAGRISHQVAELRLRFAHVVGQADVRRIELAHLDYDPWILTGSDLVNLAATTVGTIEVRRADGASRVHAVDVTGAVRRSLRRGDRYCAFRLRDVDAEARGNVDVAPTGAVVAFDAEMPVLEVRDRGRTP